jgi:hypothetical protein
MTTAIPESQPRRFGLSVGGMLLLIATIMWWFDQPRLATVLGSVGGVLFLGGLLVPRWLIPIERRWMAAAAVLGAFNARVILTVSYYVVVTPFGVLMRLVGRDPLDRRLGTGDSYWQKRPAEPPPSRERYARQS